MIKVQHTFSLLFLTISINLFGQVRHTDLISEPGDKSSNPAEFTFFNDRLLFTASTEAEGRELWITDGTTDGTKLLKEISSGSNLNSSAILDDRAVVLNNKLYFIGNDGLNGKQLWSTDGTMEATVRITDIENLNTDKLTTVGNDIYFLSKPSDYLLDLWKSDGSSEGTVIVKANIPIVNSPSYEGSVNGLFFFFIQEEGSFDGQLWRTDGTDIGTFPIIEGIDGNGAGPTGSSSLTQYIEYNNELYFVARSISIFSHPTSVGIMKTDGTVSGTTPIKGVQNGNRVANIADVKKIGDKLYFSFFEADYRHLFIWESDGTESGTTKIYDESGSKYYAPSNLATDGVDLVFTGKSLTSETALLKLSLDSYEITEIKELVKDIIYPGYIHGSTFINQITELPNGIFHISVYSDFYYQTWISDLTEVNTIKTEDLDRTRGIIYDKNSVYFLGQNEFGSELWKANLDFSSPSLLANINTSKYGLDNSYFTSVNDEIFFNADDGNYGKELWLFNPETKETTMIKDLYEGEYGSSIQNMVAHNNLCYFTASTPDFGHELWRSDGTSNGTFMIESQNSGYNYSIPINFVLGMGKLFFSSEVNGLHYLCSANENSIELITDLGTNSNDTPYRMKEMVGSESKLFYTRVQKEDLWVSNGTESGTIMLQDFNEISNLTVVGDGIYFSAYSLSLKEYELWKSDGTIDGTVLVKDIGQGISSSPQDLVAFNDNIVFTAYTEANGREYWKSDGTEAGTQMIADIYTGTPDGSITTDYEIFDDELYFVANDGSHGFELWKSNASFTNVSMVSDINEGIEGSFPANLITIKDQLYFSAFTDEKGIELWTSNGTEGTTEQVFDLAEGTQSSSPKDYMQIGNEIYFSAESSDYGRQLWSDERPVLSIEPDKVTSSETFEIYPNPAFDFVHIENKDQIYYSIEIFNLNGQKMKAESASSGEIFVGDLSSGIYVLVANSNDKRLIRKLIKE